MPVFAYKAIDERRAVVTGTIAADSPRQARDGLRMRGLRVEEVRVQESVRQGSARWLFRKRTRAAQVASLLREMATLLAVGIDLVEALGILAQQHGGHVQTAILLLKDRVAGGARLAEAMAEQPGVFNELTLRMVEVGESSGNLEVVLDQLADFQERSLQLRDRVLGTMIYPAIVFTTALGVTLFLMTVVVPMLLTNLVESGRTLPWPTRVLKGMSDALLEHGGLLALAGLVLGIAVVAVIRTKRGRRLWHRVQLWLPLFGSLAQRQAISRLAATMATLMRSGIVYLQAAEIAAKATGNVVIREALLESGRQVAAGKDIGEALKETGVFPPLVIHIFSIGQRSGELEPMLDRLAVDYDRQVNTLANRLASALEPLLILMLAIVVGFILFATLLPILEAGNVL